MARMYCLACGTSASPKRFTKGSFLLELLLWLCFLVPGFIYSLWRLSSRYKGCPECGAPHMIPLDSPRARQVGAPEPERTAGQDLGRDLAYALAGKSVDDPDDATRGGTPTGAEKLGRRLGELVAGKPGLSRRRY